MKLPSLVDFERDYNSLKNQPVLKLEINLQEAWGVMAQLQLALRHPMNQGASAEIGKSFALLLQEKVSITPVLEQVAEAGWNKEYDSYIPD